MIISSTLFEQKEFNSPTRSLSTAQHRAAHTHRYGNRNFSLIISTVSKCAFFYGNCFFPIRSSVHPTIHTSIFVFQHLCVCNPRLFSHPFHFENSVRNIQMMYGLGPAQQGLSWFPDSFYITHKYIHPNTFICVCGLKNNIYCYFSPNRKQNEIK